MSTVSGHPSFWPCGIHLYVDTPRSFDHLIVKSFSFWDLVLRTPYQRFAPNHNGVGDFRSLGSHSCIKWQRVSLLCSLRLFYFSNDVCSAPHTPGGPGRNQRLHSWLDESETLTKILVPICLYCLKCTKCGHLVLRKYIEIVTTRYQILRLKCTF